MHSEIWLRPNRRAVLVGLVLSAGSAVAAAAVGTVVPPPWRWVAVAVAVLLAGRAAFELYQLQRPRLAYRHGELLVYLRVGRPLRVPIDVVECFFLGQGPALLPSPQGRAAETATIIVRLAEAAAEWQHRDVRPSLGMWCEGYITVRGTWCEPISAELVGRLNARLVAVHRQRRGAPTAEAT